MPQCGGSGKRSESVPNRSTAVAHRSPQIPGGCELDKRGWSWWGRVPECPARFPLLPSIHLSMGRNPPESIRGWPVPQPQTSVTRGERQASGHKDGGRGWAAPPLLDDSNTVQACLPAGTRAIVKGRPGCAPSVIQGRPMEPGLPLARQSRWDSADARWLAIQPRVGIRAQAVKTAGDPPSPYALPQRGQDDGRSMPSVSDLLPPSWYNPPMVSPPARPAQ